MNRFVSVALAGTMALSAVAVSATGASADGWHRHYRPHYAAPSYDPGPAIVAGAIFGLALGAMAQPYPAYPPPPPPPPYPGYYPTYGADPHFQWCTANYESYNGETDTWTDYRGVPHRCVGPY